MGVDHPGNLEQEVAAWRREVRRVAKMTMQNASIGRAGLRVYDGGVITIENGGLHVTGTATIVGVLTGDGEFVWTGPVTISGPATISGDTDITGALTISGDTDLTGTMTVTGDIVVSASGRIQVGGMVLDPDANGGSLKFAGGPEVYASGAKLSLYSGSGAWVELDGTMAKINGPGAKWIEVTSSNIRLVGVPTKPQSAVPGSVLGMLWADASDNVFKIGPG